MRGQGGNPDRSHRRSAWTTVARVKQKERQRELSAARDRLADLSRWALAPLVIWALFSDHRAFAYGIVLAVFTAAWLPHAVRWHNGDALRSASPERTEQVGYGIVWIGLAAIVIGELLESDVVAILGALLCVAGGVTFLVPYLRRRQGRPRT